MGKLTTYVLIMSGLVLLFYFTGILTDTANTTFLNLLLSPENLRATAFSTRIIAILEGVVIGGILIGGLMMGNLEAMFKATFVIYLLNLLWDFIMIFNAVRSANVVLAILFFAPLLFLFYLTIIEWWGKHD